MGSGRTWPHDFRFLTGLASDDGDGEAEAAVFDEVEVVLVVVEDG